MVEMVVKWPRRKVKTVAYEGGTTTHRVDPKHLPKGAAPSELFNRRVVIQTAWGHPEVQVGWVLHAEWSMMNRLDKDLLITIGWERGR